MYLTNDVIQPCSKAYHHIIDLGGGDAFKAYAVLIIMDISEPPSTLI